jgi:hypothetical protein
LSEEYCKHFGDILYLVHHLETAWEIGGFGGFPPMIEFFPYYKMIWSSLCLIVVTANKLATEHDLEVQSVNN